MSDLMSTHLSLYMFILTCKWIRVYISYVYTYINSRAKEHKGDRESTSWSDLKSTQNSRTRNNPKSCPRIEAQHHTLHHEPEIILPRPVVVFRDRL